MAAGIAGRREISDPHVNHSVRGLGNNAVLKHGFGKVNDVVHNHIGAQSNGTLTIRYAGIVPITWAFWISGLCYFPGNVMLPDPDFVNI